MLWRRAEFLVIDADAGARGLGVEHQRSHRGLQLRSELLLPPALDRLTAREREVLLWLAGGKPNAEIAGLLGIRPGTVKRHLENLYAKLGVGNRTDAARLFQRLEPRSG